MPNEIRNPVTQHPSQWIDNPNTVRGYVGSPGTVYGRIGAPAVSSAMQYAVTDPAYQPSAPLGEYPADSMMAPANSGNTVSGLLGAMLPYAGLYTRTAWSPEQDWFAQSPYGPYYGAAEPNLMYNTRYTQSQYNPMTPEYAIPSDYYYNGYYDTIGGPSPSASRAILDAEIYGY